MPNCPIVDATSEFSSGGWSTPETVDKASSWEGAVSITLDLPTEEAGHSEGQKVLSSPWALEPGYMVQVLALRNLGQLFFFQLYWHVIDKLWQVVN